MARAMCAFTQPCKNNFKTWSHRNMNKLIFSLKYDFCSKIYVEVQYGNSYVSNYLCMGHEDILTVKPMPNKTLKK